MNRGKSPFKSLFIGVFSIFGISLILIFFSRCAALKNVKEDLLQYKSGQRLNLDYSDTKKEIVKEIKRRFWAFVKEAKSSDKKESSFSISINELNSLIVHEDFFLDLKDRFKFFIRDKILFADVSFPLEFFAKKMLLPEIKYSYLNGVAEFYTYIKSKVVAGNFLFFSLKQFIPSGKDKGLDGLAFLHEQNLFGYLAKTQEEYQLTEFLIGKINSIKFEGENMVLSIIL